jgi:hypothetical protein
MSLMKKHMDLQSFSSPYLTFPFSGAATFLFRHLGDVTPLIVNNNFPILIHFTSLYLGSKLPDILGGFGTKTLESVIVRNNLRFGLASHHIEDAIT